MFALLASGHVQAAEWLYLAAAVLFGLAALLQLARRSHESALVPAGLCCVAVAFLIL